MIYYQSTRGKKELYTFCEAILKPMSDDGGLLVPNKIPQFSQKQLQFLSKLPYQNRVEFLFELFKTDLSKKILVKVIKKAYTNNFSEQNIAPIVKLKDRQYILELWHGPTSAFKDIALQIVPLLLFEAAKVKNRKRRKYKQNNLNYLVLVVTTGDTGKAALEGFKNVKGFYIMVFYPAGDVSQFQELQMITQEGKNVRVYRAEGNVDLTDTVVKKLYEDSNFVRKLLKNYSVVLSSANSTNWARIIPQMAYYISSYIDLVDKNVIELGEKIDVAVPTGSFGNILSAFYTKQMGLPIRRLICASNENNVVTEFLQTGVYDSTKHILVATPSNSMDTLIAYNIERLLYSLTGDVKQITSWMNVLKTKGKFEVDSSTKKILQDEFFADWVSNKNCLANMKKIHLETGYVMDPHTSVAQLVVEKYLKNVKKRIPTIIVSTAHWAKFPRSTYEALTSTKSLYLDEFKILEDIRMIIPKAFIPKNITDLKYKYIRFNESCKPVKEELEQLILSRARAL